MAVQYNFDAAKRVSEDLRLLNVKLKDFIGARSAARKSMLDAPENLPSSAPWVGKRRNDFDGDYEGQEASLISLADFALELKRQIDRATTDAQSAKDAEKKDD